MKTLIQYIKESVNWVGSGWESLHTYQFIDNQFSDKLTSKNIKNQLDNLINNYKWNKFKHEWVDKETELTSESEIEKWVENRLTSGKNPNYSKFTIKTIEELIKKIYDEFINWRTGPHPFIKNKEGKILDIKDWLKMPCDYNSSWENFTWEEHFNKKWKELQDDKERTKQYLIDYAKYYLRDAIDVSERMIRNIKLDKDIKFGSIAFNSGRMTREKNGYLKIGEKSIEGKTLFLEYCENESEAIELPTVGDLLDLIYKYNEVKLSIPVGVLNTKYANSINVKFDNNFNTGQLGILRFRS